MIDINDKYRFVWWFHPTRNIQITKLKSLFDENKIAELLSHLLNKPASTNQFKSLLSDIYGNDFNILLSKLVSSRSDVETTRPILDTFCSVIPLVKRQKREKEWFYSINNIEDAKIFIQNPGSRKGIMQRLLLDFKIPNMHLPKYKVKIKNFKIKYNSPSKIRNIKKEDSTLKLLKYKLTKKYSSGIDQRGYIHPYKFFNTHPFLLLMKILFKLEKRWDENNKTQFPGIKLMNLIPYILTCTDENNENIEEITEEIFSNLDKNHKDIYNNWLTLAGKGKHEVDLLINRPSKFSPDCSWVKVWAEYFGLISVRAGKIVPVRNLSRDILLRLI